MRLGDVELVFVLMSFFDKYGLRRCFGRLQSCVGMGEYLKDFWKVF